MQARFVSIRLKFILSVTAVILLFGGIAMLVTYRTVADLSRSALSNKAGLILNLLRDQVSEMAVSSNPAGVSDRIRRMRHDNPDVLYILVLDREGRVIAHTFGRDSLLLSPESSAADSVISRYIGPDGGPSVLQRSGALIPPERGSVVVGLDESTVNEHGRKVAALLFSVFSLLLFFVILSMILLSQYILRPVRVIIRALEGFVPGHPLPTMKITSHDEMQLLGSKFMEIMSRINSMEEESKQTQLKMIETEKLASVGTLASGVAHEINNPVAGIEICAHRLQKHAPLDAKQKEYVTLIVEAAGHIKTIVKSLLAYVRQPNQESELVDLRWVVQFSLKLLQYRLQKKSITVAWHEPESPCLVWGVRTQLVQVAINGIINAIEASFADSGVTIGIEEKTGGFLLFIADDGSGVDSGVAGKVFDPFFTTKGNDGTGLGLYVSYNIVAAHKGSISLVNRESGGARLDVFLPKGSQIAAATDPFTRAGRRRCLRPGLAHGKEGK